MTKVPSTVDIDYFRPEQQQKDVPGILVIFLGGAPHFEAHPLVDGQLEVGRAAPAGVSLDDRAASRRHARIALSDDHFEVEDLGSRNGLVVDGEKLAPNQRKSGARVVRLGQTLLVLERDIRHLHGGEVSSGEAVVGPRLRQTWETINSIASSSDVVHIRGESGSGKELAARRFHDAGRDGKRPFVPVNCAAIPTGVAERLLFGARKGAYSGAHADAEGLVQAADGGTLFLDEVGELELEIQAKLLRVIESRTVLPIGEVKPRTVEVRLVSATHQDLRQQVANRTFREDLFFRIGRPEVELPALRARPEEIPWLVAKAVHAISSALSSGPDLVEACVLRNWPGNVRELMLEAREAARRAELAGESQVLAVHLDDEAGRAHQQPDPGRKGEKRIEKSMLPDRDAIEATLRETGGRVATAARKLGVHRNQLRRWLAENEVDPTRFAGGDD